MFFVIKYSYMSVLVWHRIALEFLLDILYYPLWWYTGGLKRTAIFCLHSFEDANLSFSPGLWLKNLFVPMYGQTDWQGRITSVFMRVVNVIGRTFALGVVAFALIVLLIVWIVLPPFVLYMLAVSIFV